MRKLACVALQIAPLTCLGQSLLPPKLEIYFHVESTLECAADGLIFLSPQELGGIDSVCR